MSEEDMIISRRQLALALVLTAGTGCQANPDSAQGVAQRFVDQHYVQINLAEAEKLSTGLAQQKVREGMRLTQGFAIDASTRKPQVRYRLEPRSESDDEATFLFDATIEVEDADTFSRRWIVLTKKVDGEWKVANFSEEPGTAD